MNWWQKNVAWILAVSMLIFAVLCVFYISVGQTKVNQTLNEFIRQSEKPFIYSNEDIPPAGRLVRLSAVSARTPPSMPATRTDAEPDNDDWPNSDTEQPPDDWPESGEYAEPQSESELLYGIYQALIAIFSLLVLAASGVCGYLIFRPFRFLWR